MRKDTFMQLRTDKWVKLYNQLLVKPKAKKGNAIKQIAGQYNVSESLVRNTINGYGKTTNVLTK